MRRRILDWLGIPSPFGAAEFRARERFRRDYVRLADALDEHVDFSTVLDVGCANGFLLEELRLRGHQVAGIEISPEVHEVLPAELTPLVEVGDFTAARGEWDLVVSIEVAEHIAPERSVELVETLAARARRAIFFTAAPPGQRGRGHINCRPHEEWLSWFGERGWTIDQNTTGALRRDLEKLEEAGWLRRNSFLLRRAW